MREGACALRATGSTAPRVPIEDKAEDDGGEELEIGFFERQVQLEESLHEPRRFFLRAEGKPLQTMSIPGEGASAPAPVRAQLDRLKGQPQEG